jgi:hypothetical protein
MSTLVEDLYALLVTLAPAGGVWPHVNTSQAIVYPYITFMRVVSTDNVSHGGPSNTQNTRFQIDTFSQTMAGLVALDNALNAALAAWSVQNVPISSQDLYEDSVKAFRTTRDVSVWATN